MPKGRKKAHHGDNYKHNTEHEQSLEEHRHMEECTQHSYCYGSKETLANNGAVCVCVGGIESQDSSKAN